MICLYRIRGHTLCKIGSSFGAVQGYPCVKSPYWKHSFGTPFAAWADTPLQHTVVSM